MVMNSLADRPAGDHAGAVLARPRGPARLQTAAAARSGLRRLRGRRERLPPCLAAVLRAARPPAAAGAAALRAARRAGVGTRSDPVSAREGRRRTTASALCRARPLRRVSDAGAAATRRSSSVTSRGASRRLIRLRDGRSGRHDAGCGAAAAAAAACMRLPGPAARRRTQSRRVAPAGARYRGAARGIAVRPLRCPERCWRAAAAGVRLAAPATRPRRGTGRRCGRAADRSAGRASRSERPPRTPGVLVRLAARQRDAPSERSVTLRPRHAVRPCPPPGRARPIGRPLSGSPHSASQLASMR